MKDRLIRTVDRKREPPRITFFLLCNNEGAFRFLERCLFVLILFKNSSCLAPAAELDLKPHKRKSNTKLLLKMLDSMVEQLECNRFELILPYYPYSESAVKAVSAAQTLGWPGS